MQQLLRSHKEAMRRLALERQQIVQQQAMYGTTSATAAMAYDPRVGAAAGGEPDGGGGKSAAVTAAAAVDAINETAAAYDAAPWRPASSAAAVAERAAARAVLVAQLQQEQAAAAAALAALKQVRASRVRPWAWGVALREGSASGTMRRVVAFAAGQPSGPGPHQGISALPPPPANPQGKSLSAAREEGIRVYEQQQGQHHYSSGQGEGANGHALAGQGEPWASHMRTPHESGQVPGTTPPGGPQRQGPGRTMSLLLRPSQGGHEPHTHRSHGSTQGQAQQGQQAQGQPAQQQEQGLRGQPTDGATGEGPPEPAWAARAGWGPGALGSAGSASRGPLLTAGADQVGGCCSHTQLLDT